MSIKERRLKLGWSQEDLARHSGLSTRTIQRIESGQRAGLESLKSLAAVFETSISTLREEQVMQDKPDLQPHKAPLINQVEREAIEFAQSILKGSTKANPDPLSEVERSAVAYAKRLIAKFSD